MKIHELKIEGFKSIGEIKLVEPNPFSVFVGPNGAGKSNFFEALELFQSCNDTLPQIAMESFGKVSEFIKQTKRIDPYINYFFDLGEIKPALKLQFERYNYKKGTYKNFGKMFQITNPALLSGSTDEEKNYHLMFDKPDYLQFTNFTKLFIGNGKIRRIITNDSKLSPDAASLEKVLKRILKNERNKEEIIEILQLLVPGFSNVEIKTEELSGSDNLVIYEDSLEIPLTKGLISDGTYNILSIITAIFQSEKPQFLLIEEPENGLNPKVVRELVTLFRDKCKEKGHYIWLNTHSQTLVSELTTDEIILVDKVNGNTQAKQVKGVDLHGMKMDEALLTNALGGGIPW